MTNLKIDIGDCVLTNFNTSSSKLAFIIDIINNDSKVIYKLIDENLSIYNADINDISSVYSDENTYKVKVEIPGDPFILCKGLNFKHCIQIIFDNFRGKSFEDIRFYIDNEVCIIREKDNKKVYQAII